MKKKIQILSECDVANNKNKWVCITEWQSGISIGQYGQERQTTKKMKKQRLTRVLIYKYKG